MEYGLTDIQEYYANTGALKRAAQARRGEPPGQHAPASNAAAASATFKRSSPGPAVPCPRHLPALCVQVARPGAKIGCSIVEAFSKDVRPRELEEVLRLEYRSKLLNPK